MNDYLNLSGHISWAVYNENGIVLKGETPNVVTSYGKKWMASVLGAGASTSIWFGLGTSFGATGQVSADDASLFSEVPSSGYGYQRYPATKRANENTIEYSSFIDTISSPITIKEVGLFPNSTTGSSYLLAHQVVDSFQLGPSFTGLQITWVISIN